MFGLHAENRSHRFFGILRSGLKLILILCLLSGSTYAWFCSFRSPDGFLTFTTGSVYYPPLDAWTFRTYEESSENAAGEWVKQTDVAKDPDDGSRKIGEVTVVGNDETGYTFDLSELQFGTIDNLLTVKKDNTIYFRIKIDRARFGDSCRLEAGTRETEGENDFPFVLYDGSKAKSTGYYTKIDSTDTENGGQKAYLALRNFLEGTEGEAPSPLLIFDYFVSTEEYEPDDIEDLLHPASGEPLEMSAMPMEGADIVNTDTEAETYYIYLRITPSLDAFVKISKEFYHYMPCIILYDARITFSATVGITEP
ncbi:MAG: hypothetical protein MJ082_00735 [Clostridia bacterium]|nr:hypothetical protein [Clostridia bacterium]